MLVHAKSTLGVLTIDAYRVYGRGWHREPTDIPFHLYQANKDCLADASYRVSGIAFTYTELKFLPDDSIDTIARGMKILYDDTWSRKKKIDTIKTAIRDGGTTF